MASHNRGVLLSGRVEILLGRLDGVQRAGGGWRAKCPACGGRSRKLSIAVADERALVHCFGGCSAIEIIEAVGLRWVDLMQPRSWPESPDERARAQRAIREAGWSAALSVLSLESKVALIAARDLNVGRPLTPGDEARLAMAVSRIDHATTVLLGAH